MLTVSHSECGSAIILRVRFPLSRDQSGNQKVRHVASTGKGFKIYRLVPEIYLYCIIMYFFVQSLKHSTDMTVEHNTPAFNCVKIQNEIIYNLCTSLFVQDNKPYLLLGIMT